MKRHIMFQLILIAILVTGCATDQGPLVAIDPTAPCDVILHPAMLSLPFDALAQGAEETVAWIMSEFPTATVEFEPYELGSDNDLGTFRWSEGDKSFLLYLVSNIQYLDQRQLSSERPTLGHVLHCFGAPDYYTLAVGVPIGGSTLGTLLKLWYPDLGIVFGDGSIQYTGPVRYTADSIMDDSITVIPTGGVEEVIQYYFRDNVSLIQEQIALLQPWPKNFTVLIGGE